MEQYSKKKPTQTICRSLDYLPSLCLDLSLGLNAEDKSFVFVPLSKEFSDCPEKALISVYKTCQWMEGQCPQNLQDILPVPDLSSPDRRGKLGNMTSRP